MIDCDVHCAPGSLEDLAPYMDAYWREYASNAGIALKGLGYGYPPVARKASIPTTYEMLRGDLLDSERPEFALLNCLTLFETHRHPYYAAALATAANEWLREEWLGRDERLRASIVVPTQSPDLAADEVRRVGSDPRFVQVLLPVRTAVPYGNRRYHEIYRAAVEHDLVIGLHAWGFAGSAAVAGGMAQTYFEDYLSNQIIVQSHVLSLVSEGVFKEFPDLRVCLLECGFTWLPALLWRFDKDWKGLWPETPWVTEKPSSYVRRHIRASTSPAALPADLDQAREVLELVSPELLVYSSDHPQAHGIRPDLLETLLGDAAADVMTTNARTLYGLAG